MEDDEYGIDINGDGDVVGLWFDHERCIHDEYCYIRITPAELNDLATEAKQLDGEDQPSGPRSPSAGNGPRSRGSSRAWPASVYQIPSVSSPVMDTVPTPWPDGLLIRYRDTGYMYRWDATINKWHNLGIDARLERLV